MPVEASNNVNNPQYAQQIKDRQAGDEKVKLDAASLAGLMDRGTVHIGEDGGGPESDAGVITDDVMPPRELSPADVRFLQDLKNGTISAKSVDFNNDGAIDKTDLQHAEVLTRMADMQAGHIHGSADGSQGAAEATEAASNEAPAEANDASATDDTDGDGYTDAQEEAVSAYYENGTQWTSDTEAAFAELGLSHDDMVNIYEGNYTGESSSAMSEGAAAAEASGKAGLDFNFNKGALADIKGQGKGEGKAGAKDGPGKFGASVSEKSFGLGTGIANKVIKSPAIDLSHIDMSHIDMNIDQGDVNVSDGPGQDGGNTAGFKIPGGTSNDPMGPGGFMGSFANGLAGAGAAEGEDLGNNNAGATETHRL